ncbi:uncharacterized protein F5Z01DRAFT_74546 [Emericellopsis atlantica]|uniref:F-box domain-containing protein n=1 Tax=Emericellopsis atlantica TaxID=2614577 RepID=A0A9P7ZNC0_9HYPO|nr:uncharacterized protein F5Z01DRAFT_74546 [Emericellopsis atlantica]KAG9255101.1 hypothetical protein F5Z01DRAFT_74546 [Emericellopsis atlantica]
MMWQKWEDLDTQHFIEYSEELHLHGAPSLYVCHGEPAPEIPVLSSSRLLCRRLGDLTRPVSPPRSEDQIPNTSPSRRIEEKDLIDHGLLASRGQSAVTENSQEDIWLSFEGITLHDSSLGPASTGASTRGSRLLDMPTEIQLLIMQHVKSSPLSLHWLRQTSAVFMSLFDKEHFASFHVPSESYRCHKSFDLSRLNRGELYLRGVRLFQYLHCSSCRYVFQSGNLAREWQKLLSARYCVGCKETHRSYMFLPEDRERHDREGGRLLCIGRQGEVSICDHSNGQDAKNAPTMWRHMEELKARRESSIGAPVDHGRFCPHQSHMPYSQHLPLVGTAMPKLIAHSEAPGPRSRLYIGYGWDLPLLYVHTMLPPSLQALRDTVAERVLVALKDRKICPHVSPEREIRDFIQSGICECFLTYANVASEAGVNCGLNMRTNRPRQVTTCMCARQNFIRCRECGAAYMWRLRKGVLSLTFRYFWHIKKPISVGWISLLDQSWHIVWLASGCRSGGRGACGWGTYRVSAPGA